MIDLKKLDDENPLPETGRTFIEDYKLTLKNRGMDPLEIHKLLEINGKRKILIGEMERARAHQNKVGQDFANLKKEKKAPPPEVLTEMQTLSRKIKEMAKDMEKVAFELKEHLSQLPNICHHTTPIGASEAENQVLRSVGPLPSFDFEAKEHFELGEKLDILDFGRASKVTGARFVFLKGSAALLERSLIQFMMDIHVREHGYVEVIPPFVVNSHSMFGAGQFPKFKEDVFHLDGTDYYLVPTAEVPVTNMFAEEILSVDDLPQRFVAYSPCFRSEAGSYGRDTRGLIRQHQFNKVELLKFVHPNESYNELEMLTTDAEAILQKLELPYRVSALCTGDIGFGASKCYDLEVWLPGQKAYREISSCSVFEDFQARRANIRFRDRDRGAKVKPQFVHTINGSGLAIGRTLIAILENYQQKDGSVKIPKALHPYTGGLTHIR